jgi:predicted alpha/beta-fold hydrolase
LQPFEPFFRNPHLSTLAAYFWSRPDSERRWPVESVKYQTEPGVQVLVHEQRPDAEPRGELVLVHGLEGSSAAGYARSMAYAALEAGYATHRVNMRSCGGSESLALSNYHSGQTSDVLHILRERKRASGLPLFLAGFSLGGNVSLKLAGELGESGGDLLSGVCAVSTPIDLTACAKAIDETQNYIYKQRFLACLTDKIRRRARQAPHLYTTDYLKRVRTIYDFDEYYTARMFDFGSADNYYRTQSSNQFLEKIRVPALVITSKDDPLIPFRMYDHPAFRENSNLRLIATDHGGHVGFVARRRPRFWLDGVMMDWMEEIDTTLRKRVAVSGAVTNKS